MQMNQQENLSRPKETDRKYGCPCGKTYLSYPALFTHVKHKHDGQPPGQLIKPKTDKARGRPKININNSDEQHSDDAYDFQTELARALEGKETSYEGEIETTEGKTSCSDMASSFYREFKMGEGQMRTLACFLNYLRARVQQHYDQNYWENHHPNDIIDISNQVVQELEIHKKGYPLEKQLLIELLYILFKWMFKNKWTDHKLEWNSAQEADEVALNHNDE